MLGKLRTDDPITKFFVGVPSDKCEITVHQLLTHTSGFRRDVGNKNSLVSLDQMTSGLFATPLVSRPGEKFSYSNAGYTLLAAIIEKASGISFQAFMHEYVFLPLGMSRTGFYNEKQLWSDNDIAHSYFETVEEGVPTDWPLTWSATGNGHVISTMTDLFKWENGLRHNVLLSSQDLGKLFSPYTKVDESSSYGYGWFIKKRPQGKHLFFHAGFYRSFGTEYRRYVDEDIVVIVASNQGYLEGRGLQDPLSDPVSAIALGNDPPTLPDVITLSDELLRRCDGTYQLPSGAQFEIRTHGECLKVEMAGQEAFNAICPDTTGRVEFAKCNAEAAFIIDATQRGDRHGLERLLSHRDYDAYAPLMDSGWSSLAKQFGPFKSRVVLGTAQYPFGGNYLRTYARLNFERDSVIVTFGYRDGVFFDLSTWEGAPNPGALCLAPVSASEFVTYNLWTGKASKIRFDTATDGTVSGFKILAGDRGIMARRVN